MFKNPRMEALRRDLNSLVDLRLYAERLPTCERQELLCAVCLGRQESFDEAAGEVQCPLYRGGKRLCGQSKLDAAPAAGL